MSSIFDSVDRAAAKRKNIIMSNKETATVFGSNTHVVNVNASGGTDTVTNTVIVQHGVGVFSSARVSKAAWAGCVVCLFIPFFAFIFKAGLCVECNVDNIRTLPYDCDRFYLGLFVALPGVSVYLFCCYLYFYTKCRQAIAMSSLSVFIFLYCIEHSCLHARYVSDELVFYVFSAGIVFGMGSQYLFFMNSQPTEFAKVMFLTNLSISSLLLIVTCIINVIFAFMPSSRVYFVLLYTRVIPITFVFLLHVMSTIYTLFPVDLVVSNLAQNTAR